MLSELNVPPSGRSGRSGRTAFELAPCESAMCSLKVRYRAGESARELKVGSLIAISDLDLLRVRLRLRAGRRLGNVAAMIAALLDLLEPTDLKPLRQNHKLTNNASRCKTA